MGKWSVQYVRKSIQKHRMKWLYVINVGKVTRFFFFSIYCILEELLICFMKEDICLALTAQLILNFIALSGY